MSEVLVCRRFESTFLMSDPIGWAAGLVVSGDGKNLVSHAGAAALRLLADRCGLTGALSSALARRGFDPVHDRGRVLADLAVVIADGATTFSGFDVLGESAELYGPIASVPTAWRALAEIGEQQLARIARATAKTRRHVWKLIEDRHGGLPVVRIADRQLTGVTCIRIDATMTPAHSDKEGAAANFKGFGHHPLLAYCDNTAEPLYGLMRPGSAGSNTASDHLEVLEGAVGQLPARQRRRMLITVDGAGASHDLIDRLGALGQRPGRQVWYSVGWEAAERERTAIGRVPEHAWQIAIDGMGRPRIRAEHGDNDGEEIEAAHVVELTALLRDIDGRGAPDSNALAGWPESMRIYCRRERPHPGAQLSLFEHADGWRYQLWCTNVPDLPAGHHAAWLTRPAYADACHRVHARVEDRIRTGKDTGIGHFPSQSYAINTAWLAASLLAAMLLAWFALLALDGRLVKAEPKTIRYRLLHVAARLTRGGRRHYLRIDETWPWTGDLVKAFGRIQALPAGP